MTPRWWFENRSTGELTIAQFPNWPLFAIGALALARRFLATDTAISTGVGFIIIGLWFFWGGDEVVRGVNPWRRLLGASVIVWQIVQLVV